MLGCQMNGLPETSGGIRAPVGDATLVVVWNSLRGIPVLTLDDDTTVQFETATFPGLSQPVFYAYLVPDGLSVKTIDFLDPDSGDVAGTIPGP